MKDSINKTSSNNQLRFFGVFIIAKLTALYFISLRSDWLPAMHYKNKAFGDVALILIMISLFIGSAARLFPFMNRYKSWLKEIGIVAIILSLIHVYIVLKGWIEWDFAELFGYALNSRTNQYVLTDPGFALANIVGIIALLYGLVLLLTSNNSSVRFLTYDSWKYLQQRSVHILYLFAAIHTAYFLYFYFFAFPRKPPPPNFFIYLFPALFICLSAIQAAAFCKQVLINRRVAIAQKS